MNYNSKSWIDPRIELRPSPIQGSGMFAKETIRSGDVLVVWGSILFTEAEIEADRAKKHTVSAVGEGL